MEVTPIQVLLAFLVCVSLYIFLQNTCTCSGNNDQQQNGGFHIRMIPFPQQPQLQQLQQQQQQQRLIPIVRPNTAQLIPLNVGGGMNTAQLIPITRFEPFMDAQSNKRRRIR